jgi:hypothetical protein
MHALAYAHSIHLNTWIFKCTRVNTRTHTHTHKYMLSMYLCACVCVRVSALTCPVSFVRVHAACPCPPWPELTVVRVHASRSLSSGLHEIPWVQKEVVRLVPTHFYRRVIHLCLQYRTCLVCVQHYNSVQTSLFKERPKTTFVYTFCTSSCYVY